MPQSPYDELVEYLRARLRRPLPGIDAQLTMAPEHRLDAQLANVAGKTCREAGVLVTLFPLNGEPALLLTARHLELRNHAGQVSFPGGRREDGEPLLRTALREAHEEVGIEPDQVEVLGPLTPLFVPPSNFCVYPFVAASGRLPELTPHEDEVDEILQVPLSHFLNPAARVTVSRLLRGEEIVAPCFAFGAYEIWGATAMILAELLAAVRQ